MGVVYLVETGGVGGQVVPAEEIADGQGGEMTIYAEINTEKATQVSDSFGSDVFPSGKKSNDKASGANDVKMEVAEGTCEPEGAPLLLSGTRRCKVSAGSLDERGHTRLAAPARSNTQCLTLNSGGRNVIRLDPTGENKWPKACSS